MHSRVTADATTRLQALTAAAAGPAGLAAVLTAVDDPVPEIAREALRLLRVRHAVNATEALRERLLDADPSLVTALAETLASFGDLASRRDCLDALHDARASRRLASVRALAWLADDACREALCAAATGDSIAGVREAALIALQRLGPSLDATGACARGLRDPSPQVRRAAVRAIFHLSHEPQRYLDGVISDPDAEVRIEVAHLAGRLGAGQARGLLADHDPRVRSVAARHAGPACRELVISLLAADPSPKVRLEAARGLAESSLRSAQRALIDAQEDADPLVRAAALRGLVAQLGRDALIERLRDELGHPLRAHRRAVLYALAHLTPRPEEIDMNSLTTDPDPGLRLALVELADNLSRDPRGLLAQLARDPAPRVRHAAETRLARLAPGTRA
jgi:HEAT repeat protein